MGIRDGGAGRRVDGWRRLAKLRPQVSDSAVEDGHFSSKSRNYVRKLYAPASLKWQSRINLELGNFSL